MTTIAYCDGMIAGDGLITDGGVAWARDAVKVQKIGRLLCGASGDSAWAVRFFSWIKLGCEGDCPKPASPDDSFRGIIVMTDGSICEVDNSGWLKKSSGPHAIGSGKAFALAAMVSGKSAEEAVGIAALFDPYTGGELTVLSA